MACTRSNRTLVLSAVIALLLGSLATAANAAPPLPWSHEYEDWLKYERPYERYDNRKLPGQRDRSCNRELMVGAIGGALGGYIGSRIGEDTGKLGATAAGAWLGYFIGTQLGRAMDESDAACGVRKSDTTPSLIRGTRSQPRYW